MNIQKFKTDENFTVEDAKEVVIKMQKSNENRLRDSLELLFKAIEESAYSLKLTEKMAWEYFSMLKKHCQLLNKMEDVKNA